MFLIPAVGAGFNASMSDCPPLAVSVCGDVNTTMVWVLSVNPLIVVPVCGGLWNIMFCSFGWGWLPNSNTALAYADAISSNVAKTVPSILVVTCLILFLL